MTIGIGLSLKSNLGVSPVSSIPYTITLITGIEFPKIKVAFDTLMVLISGTTCWFLLRGLGSVGAGTIISALLVGSVLSLIMKAYRHKLNAFLSGDCIE